MKTSLPWLLSSAVILALTAGCGSAPVSPATVNQATTGAGSGTNGGSGGTQTGSGSGGSGSGSTTGSGSSGTASGALSTIPAGAISVTGIQALPNWGEAYDTATSGSTGEASGIMNLVTAPSISGQARSFATTYSNSGGERYHVAFGSDPASTNFFYDVWVYLPSPSTGVANLEFDMNQVLPNGDTVIFGIQCDGYAGVWEYAENAGTPANPVPRWVKAQAPCNPRNWATDSWRHLQASYSRDNSGNVTYNSVWLDGTQQTINATVPSAFSLGWASVLLTNFQADGLGASGSSTAYLDNLTVYRW